MIDNIPLTTVDLVRMFVESGDKYVTVDVERTGRDKKSVYNNLHRYLRAHDYLGVSVRKIKGDIILVNNAKHRSDNKVRR